MNTPAPSTRLPVLSVVVPTYNERSRIEELIAAVFEVFEASGLDGELIVVDDNSPDGTGALVDRLTTRFGPRLRPLHRSGKLGLGSAVMEGLLSARAMVLGVMDADFSHPPDDLPNLYRALERTGVDAVVGSRYVPGGRVENWPVSRRLLSRAACLLARPLTPVRDATSGFFLVRREAIRDVQIHAGGFKICLELLLRGHARSVAELPYLFVDRTSGKSKMNLKEAAGYLRQLRLLALHRFVGAGRGATLRYLRLRRDAWPARAEGVSTVDG